ncbi:MAG TPA: OmpH family outer membrane protein [Tepidisphaeraceae bacterium]|nr:OmpH family outer membrane protein [Tepidisphaeraceae bacterium]
MIRRHVIAFALAVTLLLTARVVQAQEGGVRIGVCNWVKVLDAMDEWKAFRDKNENDKQKFTLERSRRKLELEDLMRQRNELKPESAQYREKAQLVAQKEIEHVVWEQMTQLGLIRGEKEAIQQMYAKIVDVVREVAETKKLDLVLAEKKPEVPQQNADRLTAADIAGILSQRDVLYSNEKVDITQAVILLVNKKYAAGAASAATGDSQKK